MSMIRNTVVNTINYFYPLGNTPAVSLTQDLPLGQDADILLLGCGDARNLLFTCFADPERKLDAMCCDIEPAIIARNLLLYTLLIDNTDNSRLQQIWNVYYHWQLDDKSADLLESQVEKLLSLSETAAAWRASVYGRVLRFCDKRSIGRIRKVWTRYSSSGATAAARSQEQEVLRKNITKASRTRRELTGGGFSVAGLRSAAPTGVLALQDISTITTKWWEEGTTTSAGGSTGQSHRLNPAFLAPTDQRLVLHYGSDPLSGFPLATAYVPLLSDSCLGVDRKGLSSSEYLSACAYQHFRAWAQAFRKTVSGNMTMRFCVADALALSLTLRRTVSCDQPALTANISCDNWTCEALVLDETEYADPTCMSPRRFDVIDTSNLIDHLGPLNIVSTCATLLKKKPWSTMYTENLVQNNSSEKERVASLFGTDIQTIALLLNLSVCEIWTNATNSPEDESVLDNLMNQGNRTKSSDSTQIRSRLRWKRVHSVSQDEDVSPLYIGTDQVIRLLVELYDHMFAYENVSSLLAGLSTGTSSKRSNPYYNRASFVLLLDSLQRTIDTDWRLCLDEIMSRIFSGFSRSSYGANFAQELMLFMHMSGIDTTRLPPVDLDASRDANLAPFFDSWRHVPDFVCVTLHVPRRTLQVFTSRAGHSTGTPTLRCDLEGGGVTSAPWSNTFTSVLVTFGDARMSRHHGMPMLQIEEDDANWWGSSDMFVSVFVPTWTLLQPDKTTPMMKCGLLPTPQSCQAFVRDLGLRLDIFGAELTSTDVTISEYMPGMTSAPRLTLEGVRSQLELQHSLSVTLSSKDTTIERLTHRASYVSQIEGRKLRDRSTSVQVRFQDAWRASIKIGTLPETRVFFPIPVDQLRHKVRIARTSSYVEIEAPPWDPLAETSLNLLFPTMQPEQSARGPSDPVSWTATHIKLDMLPIIDIADRRRMQWLNTHASMMFSSEERRIRELNMASRVRSETKPHLRVEIKEGMFTMLMCYPGLQGEQVSIFGLSKEIGGINVLFLVSSIRLDLINRTVVLDAAAVPLVNSMNNDNRVRSFYQSITSQGVMQIKVSNDELRSWKSMLPAFAERCRLWKHTPNCEYASKGEVPIEKGLEDGHSPLCSCGVGKFPPSYLQDLKHSGLQYVLKRYATRVAISPFFAVPYVEDCFFAGLPLPSIHLPASPAEQECGHCGSDKRKDANTTETKLLLCSRCRQRRYCSAECQKADWKDHKKSCSKQ